MSVKCPFEGPCFGKIDGRCRILREYDQRWKSCPFQKQKASTPEMVQDGASVPPLHGKTTRDRVIELIHSGVSVDAAANLIGVNPRTIYNWSKKGWI